MISLHENSADNYFLKSYESKINRNYSNNASHQKFLIGDC